MSGEWNLVSSNQWANAMNTESNEIPNDEIASGKSETNCGIALLQKFASIKVFLVFYGFVGCIYTMSLSYFNGTITTMEKRFKIPSNNMGVIMVRIP